MKMNIEARKITLAHRLLTIQKEGLLDKIEALLAFESTSITEEQKKAIDLGIASIENGEKTTHSHVMDETKKRYLHLFK
ncbi:MAG: putative transcriptional regulator [bacterium]|jgi:predicted transcriptional regulator